MQIGLDSNYYAELNNDRETVAEMRTRESLEAEKWERVRDALIHGREVSGRDLNDRICDGYDWASDLENLLGNGIHVLNLYRMKLLSEPYCKIIEQEARTLASIIVGADHE